MIHRSRSGFSLIELMIVVTIIGILSMIAIPSYQQYVKRARFSEVITATAPFKLAVALALQEGVSASELFNGVNGIPDKTLPTKNLAEIIVKNGVITATASKLVDKLTYILKPNENGSIWDISGSCMKAGLCSS